MSVLQALLAEIEQDPDALAALRAAVADEPDRLLTAEEMAPRLNCHYKTLQRWCCEGRVPAAFKAGRNWVMPPDAVVHPKPTRDQGQGSQRTTRIPAHDQAGRRVADRIRERTQGRRAA